MLFVGRGPRFLLNNSSWALPHERGEGSRDWIWTINKLCTDKISGKERDEKPSVKRGLQRLYERFFFSREKEGAGLVRFISCHTTRFVNLTIIASLIILPPAVKFPIKILVIPFLNR